MDAIQLRAALECIKSILNKFVKIMRRVVKWFVKWFEYSWASQAVQHGTTDLKKRAAIYLRTKSRRIRRKQWGYITPF